MRYAMTDEILTDLITAIAAARGDGNGVLTISALRTRLQEAKLRVDRVDDEAGELDYSALKDLTRPAEIGNRPQH
jgi:hypothetical protein